MRIYVIHSFIFEQFVYQYQQEISQNLPLQTCKKVDSWSKP